MRAVLDGDGDIIKQQDKIWYLETTVDFLDRVLRSLNSRTWDIKNAVEWNKTQFKPIMIFVKHKDHVHMHVEAQMKV